MSVQTVKGSLTVVGTGIQVMGQTTLEAKAHMEQADKLLFLVADPATSYWITTLNSTAESMQRFYDSKKKRIQTYNEIVDHMLGFVRGGSKACVAFYGHPGVFVYPAHEAIRRAREEGYKARMLPGISAEDCLFADVGFDPGTNGCQSFEATDFLVNHRKYDPSVALVLWQIAVVGELGYRTDRLLNEQGLQVLVDELSEVYGPDHEVIVYEASVFPICEPIIDRVPLSDVLSARVTPVATLYVPPLDSSPIDPNMVARLGVSMPAPISTGPE